MKEKDFPWGLSEEGGESKRIFTGHHLSVVSDIASGNGNRARETPFTDTAPASEATIGGSLPGR